MRYCQSVDCIMISLSKISILVRLLRLRNFFFLQFLTFPLFLLFHISLLPYLFLLINFIKIDITNPYRKFSFDQFQEEDTLDDTNILAKLYNFLNFLILSTNSFPHIQVPQKNINIKQTNLTLLIFLTQLSHNSSF